MRQREDRGFAATIRVACAVVGWLAVAVSATDALGCGTRDGTLREPSADDALFVLEAAVGLPGRCGLCVCDVDSDGSVSVRDAVLVLQRAVGGAQALTCPACVCTAGARQTNVIGDDIAMADFNADGLADFVSQGFGRTLELWLARGRGLITIESRIELERSFELVFAGDVNGDGIHDVVTATPWEGLAQLFPGLGDGTLAAPRSIPLGEEIDRVAIHDVDSDGAVDLVAFRYFPAAAITMLGNGDGTFGTEIESPTIVSLGTPRFADFDGDGDVDLIALGEYDNALVVAAGDGRGGFGPPRLLPVGSEPLDVEAADLNLDGRADVIVAEWRKSDLQIHYARESGGFAPAIPATISGFPSDLAVADIDADGRLDIVVAQGTGDLAILRGTESSMVLSDVARARAAPRTVKLADVDGDRILDAIVLDDSDLLVLTGNGDGWFQSERWSRASDGTRQVLLADVDGDETTDLVTVESFSVSAYPGDGTGDFGARAVTETLESFSESSFMADLDDDGYPDVVLEALAPTIASAAAPLGTTTEGRQHFGRPSRIVRYSGRGDGTFEAGTEVPQLLAYGIASGDVDADGRMDFVALRRDPNRIEVYAGVVGGFISIGGRAIGSRAGTLSLLDVDRDGRLDLASLNTTKDRAFLWFGRGDGRFLAPLELDVGSEPRSIVALDLDVDGYGDIVVVNSGSLSLSRFFGDANRTFRASTPILADVAGALFGAVVADFDSDGASDLAYVSQPADSYLRAVSILPGDGEGGFHRRIDFAARTGSSGQAYVDPVGIIAADLDASGAADLLIGNYGGGQNQVSFLSDPGNCLIR